MKPRLISIMTGISAKSGKRYTRITVRGKKTDGGSSLADFWLKEEVAQRMFADGISEDCWIALVMDLDEETLRPYVSFVEKVNEEDVD